MATGVRSKPLPVYLDLDERRRLIAAGKTERDQLFIEFLFHTGCRVSEAAEARVADLAPNGVRLLNLKRKVRTEKYVFVSPEFLSRLRTFCISRSGSDPIFGRCTDGRKISRVQLWKIYTRAAAKAGIFRRRFSTGELRPAWTHTARHSSAVAMMLAGAPITAVQRHLGHSRLDNTSIYTQVADVDYEKIIAKVDFG